jgi:hypothetical protein
MDPVEDEKIPVFSKWSHWYWFVIVVLVALVIFFYFFTKYFE